MVEKNKNLGSKRVPITIDDEGPISSQAEKEVKKEVEEVAPLPTVTELQEKVAELEGQKKELQRQKQRLIEIAGGHLKRAEDAVSLLEKKPEILKESKKETEDLEKKVGDLTQELAELKEHMDKLTKEKEEERRMAEESKRLLDESEKEKEELRRRLMEMEKRISEKNGSVSIVNDEPVDGDEKRAELREEIGEEPMERMEMGEQMEVPFYDNNMDISGMNGMDGDMIEHGEEENGPIEHLDMHKPHSDEEEVEKRRRSSRNVSRRVKYADSVEESDGEVGPTVKKKKRSESVEKKEKVGNSPHFSSKDNRKEKNVLKCQECEYQSRSVEMWCRHLKFKHSTTPTLARYLIRCECGHESYSDSRHRRQCEISNFTIIRTGDGTIRRLTDQQVTPQCILCEAHPKTPYGYAYHLIVHHNTTLLANGIYLLCACGTRFTSDESRKKHDNKCNGRDFTILKHNED